MNKKKLLWLFGGVVSVIIPALVMVKCTQLPSSPQTQSSATIAFNLEQMDRDKATYWGMPITAIITFPNTIVFKDIGWHLGSGFYRSAYGINDSVKQITVGLYWDKFPAIKDSAGLAADTLFITLGGGLFFSNPVYVTVRNLAPVVDSVKANTTKLTGLDSVYVYRTEGSALGNVWTFRLYTHDVNRDTVRVKWSARRNDSLTAVSQTAVTYRTPEGNFTDTITALLNDSRGAQLVHYISISRGNPNQPPNVDTLVAGDTVFITADTMLSVLQLAPDTIRLRTYPHGFAPQDSVATTWSAKIRANLLPAGDAQNSLTAQYFYRGALPAIADSIDTVFVLDTITLTARNARGYSIRKHIEVCALHPADGKRPVIDSVRIGSRKITADTGVVLAYAALIIDSVPLEVFARSFNSREALGFAWTAKNTANIFAYTGVPGKKAYYRYAGSDRRDTITVANAATVIDTVSAIVTRVTGELSRQSIVLIKIPRRYNRVPYFDSITVQDTVFKSRDSLYDYREALALDTMHFGFAVHDSDATDSLFFSWSATDTNGLRTPIKKTKNLFQGTLICRDTSYVDTLTATVSDQRQAVGNKRIRVTVTK